MNSAMTSDILISNCLIDSLVRDQIRDDECLNCTSKAADIVPSEVTVESKRVGGGGDATRTKGAQFPRFDTFGGSRRAE